MKKITHNSHDDFCGLAWKNARKREVGVAVEFSRQADVVGTLEGPVRCEAGDAIVTGIRGERWPVQRGLFETLYRPEPPLPMGADGRYRSLSQEVEVIRLAHSYRLELPGRQGTLSGKAGDWLVRKQDGSMGVVAGDVFSETYDVIE